MQKEEEKKETLVDFVVRTVDDAFIDNIPMDAIKDLPKFYMYLFGSFAELFTVSVFVYFMYSVYLQGRQQKFISISINSGECSDITKSVTGTFTADINGTWNGFPDYIYSGGIYALSFAQASITLTNYQQVMSAVSQQLAVLETESLNNNLVQNLILYTSWVFNCDPSVNNYCDAWIGQTFTFTGTAQYLFALQFVETTISNVNNDCTALSISNYDIANSLNSGSYDYSDFTSNPACNTAVNPVNLGYDSNLDGVEFYINMDVRTFVDSIAANFDILQLSSLATVLNSPEYVIHHNNYTYIATYYTDPLYPGMNPMLCLTNTDTNPSPFTGVNQLCFLVYGNISGIPIFLHYGAGNGVAYPVTPMPCNW